MISRISKNFQYSVFPVTTYCSLFVLNVSIKPHVFSLLVASIETHELICKSKFALMVSLPAAMRQKDPWFDGIIGYNTLQIWMLLIIFISLFLS